MRVWPRWRMRAAAYGVKRKGTGFAYGRLSGEDELRLELRSITLLPPNKYWLPEETPLFRYEGRRRRRFPFWAGRGGPAIVIGVHPYDLHALKTLDAVFLGSTGGRQLQSEARGQTLSLA